MNPLKIINLINKKDYLFEVFKKIVAESTEETLKSFRPGLFNDTHETAKKTIALFSNAVIERTKKEFKDVV